MNSSNMQQDSTKRQNLQELLERARANNNGERDWRLWKSLETAEVIDLFEQANQQQHTPRVEVLDIDFTGDLNMVFRVLMPVPRAPVNGELQLATSALFHVHYEEHWRREAPDGWAPLGLIEPRDAFHTNVNMDIPHLRGAVCLGDLPPGVPLKELILMGYYALTLQNHVLDERDPNGILNLKACEFYRNHQEHLPLTHAGFADPWEPPPAAEEEAGSIAV